MGDQMEIETKPKPAPAKKAAAPAPAPTAGQKRKKEPSVPSVDESFDMEMVSAIDATPGLLPGEEEEQQQDSGADEPVGKAKAKPKKSHKKAKTAAATSEGAGSEDEQSGPAANGKGKGTKATQAVQDRAARASRLHADTMNAATKRANKLSALDEDAQNEALCRDSPFWAEHPTDQQLGGAREISRTGLAFALHYLPAPTLKQAFPDPLLNKTYDEALTQPQTRQRIFQFLHFCYYVAPECYPGLAQHTLGALAGPKPPELLKNSHHSFFLLFFIKICTAKQKKRREEIRRA
jgi:hypothetical protein